MTTKTYTLLDLIKNPGKKYRLLQEGFEDYRYTFKGEKLAYTFPLINGWMYVEMSKHVDSKFIPVEPGKTKLVTWYCPIIIGDESGDWHYRCSTFYPSKEAALKKWPANMIVAWETKQYLGGVDL